MDPEVWLKRRLCTFFVFPLPTIGNFRDRWGGGLAYHEEPFDMLLLPWKTKILEQIKWFWKFQPWTSQPIVQFRSIGQHITTIWAGFNILYFKTSYFQIVSKLVKLSNVYLLYIYDYVYIYIWYMIMYIYIYVCICQYIDLSSHAVELRCRRWRRCTLRLSSRGQGPSPWRHKTHELICFKDHAS